MIQLNRVYKYYRQNQHQKVILNHVSAVFESGYSYGMLGVNGAGKSTTLRVIAGIELPNSGQVRRSVRISWPLGFAGAFHTSMSGRENLHFIARAYGADIRKVTRFVAEFSELGDYINAPVKTYSSGMMARLAFGVSLAIDFDCYLIDEVTAVGDARFRRRAKEAFDIRRKNSDLIMVSHTISDVKQYCDRGAVLVDGQLLMYSTVDEAVEMYNKLNR